MRIDVYHHFEGGVLTEAERKLNLILEIVQGLKKEESIMQAEMQVLTDQVTALKTVEDGAAAMITGMAAQLITLAQNATDLTQMKADALALAKNMADNSAPLAAAVVANTPAAAAVTGDGSTPTV